MIIIPSQGTNFHEAATSARESDKEDQAARKKAEELNPGLKKPTLSDGTVAKKVDVKA